MGSAPYPLQFGSAREFLAEWERSLSRGSLFVGTRTPQGAGSLVEVELTLPGNAGTVHILGEVAFVIAPDTPAKSAGMGVRFRLEPQAEEALRAYARELSRGRNAGRVLLVDDDKLIRVQVSALLEAAGFQVGTAEDGVTALEALEGGPFEIILSDIHMPRMDGFELRNVLLMERRTSRIPFVVITGAADDSARAIARKLGAQALVAKPIQLEPLLAVMRPALAEYAALQKDRTDEMETRRGPPEEEPVVEIDASVLDPSTSPRPGEGTFLIVCSTCGLPYSLEEGIEDERLLRSCPHCIAAGTGTR